MFAFIVRRILFLPVIFIGVTLFIVLLMQLLSPYERAVTFVTSEVQLRNIDAIVEQYGLDKPWYVQYWNWLSQAVQGNLGFSRVTNQPVLTTIAQRLPNTIELAVLTIIPTIAFGIWLGTAAALNRDRAIDQVFPDNVYFLLVTAQHLYWQFGCSLSFTAALTCSVSVSCLQTLLEPSSGPSFTAIPVFLLLDSLANGRFDIFWNALLHLVLPVATLVLVISAQIVRVMRSSLLDTLTQDYVRTARAKGLSERVVNHKHARRNALIPVLTLSGFTLVGLLNGAVIIETIFALPGVGKWLADAAVQLDYAAVLGGAVFVGVIVVVGNLIVDILYAVVDPRIRY